MKTLVRIATVAVIIAAVSQIIVHAPVIYRAVEQVSDQIRVSIPGLHTAKPEWQQLAECSGTFMAAAQTSQEDREMSDTFATAAKYSLELARESITNSVTEAQVNQLGFDTMSELLKYSERDPEGGHNRIATRMNLCVEFLNTVPTPDSRT